MAQKIKIADEDRERYLREIITKAKVLLQRPFDSRTTAITIPLEKQDIKITTKPKIIFSTTAYEKCKTLIKECSGEVGWQGFVERNGNTFLIKDIIVYPQTVTSVTVQTDEAEYAQWLLQLNNQQISELRFQCHSHVNMGVTPSATDLELYDNYLANLKDDDYYIFMIMNKKGDVNAWLYDLKENKKYFRSDLIITHENDMTGWWQKTKSLLKTPQPTEYYFSNIDDETDIYSRYFEGTDIRNLNKTKQSRRKGGKRK